MPTGPMRSFTNSADLIMGFTPGTYDGLGGTDLFWYYRPMETADIVFTHDPAGPSTFMIGGVDDTCVVNIEQYQIETGWGNDRITTGNNIDVVSTGWGRDIIDLGGGRDTANGGAGNDIIYGGDGSDELRGGTGNDALFGGNDNDQLFGGSGENFLTGGGGADVFIFSANGSEDVILDFQVGFDKIRFKNAWSEVYNQVTSIDQLEIHYRKGNAYIEYGQQNDEIELRGVAEGSLSEEDFIWE